MEKVNGIIVKDNKVNKYFGFINEYPEICSQADSIEEVNENIQKYLDRYKKPSVGTIDWTYRPFFGALYSDNKDIELG